MTDTTIPVIDTRTDSHLQRTGIIITALWLAIVGLYCWHDWTAVSTMKPQDLATFVGGVFAPLAFLWLVLGYFQQGFELRHSVEALRLQSVELANSVEQQRGLVEATREQIENERAVVVASEAAAQQSVAPIMRLAHTGTINSQDKLYQSYTLTNFGHSAHDISLKALPSGIKKSVFRMENGNDLTFSLSHILGEPLGDQFITITYRNSLNTLISLATVITTVVDDAYGHTYGQPAPLE